MNFERMFASSLLMRRSSSSFARALRMSEMKVVSPRMEAMFVSEENRDAEPLALGTQLCGSSSPATQWAANAASRARGEYWQTGFVQALT